MGRIIPKEKLTKGLSPPPQSESRAFAMHFLCKSQVCGIFNETPSPLKELERE